VGAAARWRKATGFGERERPGDNRYAHFSENFFLSLPSGEEEERERERKAREERREERSASLFPCANFRSLFLSLRSKRAHSLEISRGRIAQDTLSAQQTDTFHLLLGEWDKKTGIL